MPANRGAGVLTVLVALATFNEIVITILVVQAARATIPVAGSGV